MARKKKRQEDPPPQGAPEWITTFVDMISLLVTFFILLLTFSSIEERDILKLQTFFSATNAVWEISHGDLIHETPPEDLLNSTDPLQGALQPHSRPTEELVDSLVEMGQKQSPDHVPIDLTTVKDGLRITWDEGSSFAPGSAEVSPKLRRGLADLAAVIEHYSFLIVVEGHTDDRVPGTPERPDDVALSLARARAAADVLLAGGRIDPRVVQLAGLGGDRPRADNTTATGRQLNRRVEVRVLSLSRLLAASIDWSEERTRGADR